MQQEDLFGKTVYAEGKPQKKSPPPKPSGIYPDEPWAGTASLADLEGEIHTCLKCPLGQTRTNFVFGVGNPKADVMFIGEAPGADEDAQGEPFVGRAGQLLNKILTAINLKREEVYICNILKCRPPSNRDPETGEMETCFPYLFKQIEIIRPKFIICLGRIAGQWLLQTNENLTALRGKIHDFNGYRLIVTYHPAALLRNPNWKHPAWEDMKMFKKAYDELKA
jgi:DNA polymerase